MYNRSKNLPILLWRKKVAMLRNCWCEKISHVFNPSINARSKWCFSISMSVVCFNSWLNSLSGISFSPVLKSLFLHLSDQLPRNRIYFRIFLLEFLFTMSEFVIPLEGQRILRCSLYWQLTVFSSLCNSFPWVGSCSWKNNTLWHRFLSE